MRSCVFPSIKQIRFWVEFRVGNTLLTLRPRGREYDGGGSQGASVQLAFRVAPDEVSGCYQTLVEQNIEILAPPTDQDYGHLNFFFKDPEGNILEIYADIPTKDSILAKLTFEHVLEISEHCTLEEYAPGDTIVRQGEVADKFYIISQGRVQVINHTDTGGDIMLGWLGEGEYFGEVGLLQSHPRTATIRAGQETPVKVVAIDREGFAELMDESAEASEDISKAMYDRLMEMATKIITTSR